MTTRIDGYLTQPKLEAALRDIFGEAFRGSELRATGTRKRWDMGVVRGDRQTVVEFDGDEHYCNALKIKADREKDDIAAHENGFDFDADIEQDFPTDSSRRRYFPRRSAS